MERIDLRDINKKDTATAKNMLYQVASDYAGLIGLDFKNQIMPALENDRFWDVDYLADSQWGLSTMDAYRCLVDTHRTTQIMGGISETIKTLRSQGKKEIYAIDAGTGTGIFAIYLASLGVDKICALELNPQTAELAERFIASYGFSDKVKVLVGDATKINSPELREQPFDILVSENLSGGLFAEPQFQIIKHLSRFLHPNAPIVPYKATLSAALGYGDWDQVDWNGKPPRNVLAKRRIPNLRETTSCIEIESVVSTSEMDIPHIEGVVDFKTTSESVNTILISTVFQINETGKIYQLESDSAEFLGKTIAIKLPTEALTENGKLRLHFDYKAGFSVKNNPNSIQVEGNEISLRENN